MQRGHQTHAPKSQRRFAKANAHDAGGAAQFLSVDAVPSHRKSGIFARTHVEHLQLFLLIY